MSHDYVLDVAGYQGLPAELRDRVDDWLASIAPLVPPGVRNRFAPWMPEVAAHEIRWHPNESISVACFTGWDTDGDLDLVELAAPTPPPVELLRYATPTARPDPKETP